MLGRDNGKAGRGKLCDDYIVPSAGAVANQEFPGVVPANNKPDMGGIREQRHISGAGLASGYSGQVYTNVPIAIAGPSGVAQRPVDHAGAVQAKGPVSASGRTARRRDLLERSPAAVPAYGMRFPAPKIVYLPHKGKSLFYGVTTDLLQISGQKRLKLPVRPRR